MTSKTRREVRRVVIDYVDTCCVCGKETKSEMEHRAPIYKDKAICHWCFHDMIERAPKGRNRHHRFARLLARQSRDKILTPHEVSQLAYRFSRADGSGAPWRTADSIIPYGANMGIYRGEPLIDPHSDNEKCRMLIDLYYSESFKEMNEVQQYFVILLTILGDKNALKHSTPRNPANFRGRAATNLRNHPQYS